VGVSCSLGERVQKNFEIATQTFEGMEWFADGPLSKAVSPSRISEIR
jgi:hypothetical protein